MLEKIIHFSIKNKLVIGLVLIAWILYGLFELRRLPIDAVPDITDNQVQIITTSPSLGAPDVERFITVPLEQSLSTIATIKQIRSFSRFGLSVITVVFEEETDLYWARQQVAERLQISSKEIPQSLGTPQMAPISTGLGEIYQYVLRPKKGYEHRYGTMELRSIQDWIVRRQLLGTKGVADVASFGGHLKQYEVSLDPIKMSALQVSIDELFSALETNNANTGGAYIEKEKGVLYIRTEGLLSTKEQIAQLPVKRTENGMYVLVGDVAEVNLGHATRYGSMTYNGKEEVAGAVVMMSKGANSNQVIEAVKDKISTIEKTLPEGVVLEPFLDRTKMVNNAISTVKTNLMEGALIVVFVLIVFLGNARAGLLVASVIPLSMLFAFVLMNWFGVSGNLMSLGALDFGLIVDGAVIIVEGVLHRLHGQKGSQVHTLSKEAMEITVKDSSTKMMNSAAFGQIIILMVYIPILSLEGVEGKMFRPMAQTVIFALLGAFLLSLTYVPVMSTLLLSRTIKPGKTRTERWMETLTSAYERSLRTVLRFRKWTLAATLLLFGISVLLFTRLGGEFIPELPEGDFAVDTRVLPGSNLSTSTEAVLKSQKILLDNFPEIEKIVGKTGSSEIPTDPMPIDASDMMVILKPRKEWTSAHNYDALADSMHQVLNDHMVGVTYSFQYPVNMRFNELMTGARQDVVCKIYGDDLDSLAHYGENLSRIIKELPHASNIYLEPLSGIEQIVITFNREALIHYGVSVENLNKTIAASFAGIKAGSIFEGEQKYDLVLRLPQELRTQQQAISDLPIKLPTGEYIPLQNLAQVELKQSINQIQREQARRRLIVGFNVQGGDIQTAVEQLKSKVETSLKLPPGYWVDYGGSFENLQRARDRLLIAVPISLLTILVLLYFTFRSLKYGLLIFAVIPLSAIGGILSLVLRDMHFSISAGVGFIALFGVAVLNGIVLVSEFNRQSKIHDLTTAVRIGCTMRLRPVLMTALVASLGFLPMALSQGEGAEVQRPLATVVIGGLLLATALTLYVLPILYLWIEKKIPTDPNIKDL